VAELARYVTDDGVLVMTTPSREYIEPANHSLTLVAALSPGFHGFLLSAGAFGDCARQCGFAHVIVHRFGERLFLWASRAPITVDPARAPMLPAYRGYLQRQIERHDPASPVWQGIAYRMLKELLSEGQLVAAGELSGRLLQGIVQSHGPHVADPATVLQRLRQCVTLEDIGAVMPFFVPGLYFHLGMMALQQQRDAARAEQWWAGAVAVIVEVSRIECFLEAASLLCPARIGLADLRWARGDIAGAAADYVQIAADGGVGSRDNGYSPVSADEMEGRLPAVIDKLLTEGRVDLAAAVFDGYRTYIERRFGPFLLTADGVDRALAASTTVIPLDPLFGARVAAELAHARNGGDPACVAALRDIALIGAKWSASQRWGPRMKEHARRARRAAARGAVADAGAFSYGFSYRSGPKPPG